MMLFLNLYIFVLCIWCINRGYALDYPNLELFKEGFFTDLKDFQFWPNLIQLTDYSDWLATSYYDPNNPFWNEVLKLFNDRTDLNDMQKRVEAINYIAGIGDIQRLPFRTDTNRYSDGVTSSGAFATTSPSFPQYRGFLASPEGRHEGYKEYSSSCADQGLGLYGAGDAEKEAALTKLMKNASDLTINNPAFSKTFDVVASIKWNPSHFCIQKDESYEIEVEGPQMWQDGGIRVGPEGYESYYDALSNCYIAMGRCRGHLKKKKRIPTAPWMSLSCSIGEFVRPLQEVDPASEERPNYLPIDEAVLQETVFNVGRKTIITKTPHTGQLICFANDAHLNYWNNVGTIKVTVRRTSLPITSRYYEAQRLPACDSALIVYKYHGQQNASYCNVEGIGSGWDMSNVMQGSEEGYSEEAEDNDTPDIPSFYEPQIKDRFTTIPNYVKYESPYGQY